MASFIDADRLGPPRTWPRCNVNSVATAKDANYRFKGQQGILGFLGAERIAGLDFLLCNPHESRWAALGRLLTGFEKRAVTLPGDVSDMPDLELNMWIARFYFGDDPDGNPIYGSVLLGPPNRQLQVQREVGLNDLGEGRRPYPGSCYFALNPPRSVGQYLSVR